MACPLPAAYANAQIILNTISGDQGDPTLDEYEESIAGGNNAGGTNGVQFPPPAQTSLPGAITLPPNQSNNTPSKAGNGTPVPCVAWNGLYTAQLSPNYVLSQFTTNILYPYPLNAYPPYSANDRFCNLQNLATNIAEPMRSKFGTLTITSGLRNRSSGSNISQHITGQAMDIQFAGWSYARYWDNAQWIKDNIPYDQFIFEHSDKTGLAWFHLSYNKSGNRPATISTKVMTMYRNKFSPGLLRFA